MSKLLPSHLTPTDASFGYCILHKGRVFQYFQYARDLTAIYANQPHKTLIKLRRADFRAINSNSCLLRLDNYAEIIKHVVKRCIVKLTFSNNTRIHLPTGKQRHTSACEAFKGPWLFFLTNTTHPRSCYFSLYFRKTTGSFSCLSRVDAENWTNRFQFTFQPADLHLANKAEGTCVFTVHICFCLQKGNSFDCENLLSKISE